MKEKVILILILALALTVRWYKIDNPVADWHSWRQADTASVARVYIKDGINLFVPRFQDISAVTTGKDNPQGYRMVEFPIYNAIHALAAKNIPIWDIDQWGRVLSSTYSLFSILLLYLIIKRLSGKPTATLAALLMAILPFNIYYSRVILPEPLMIVLFLGSTYVFLKFIDRPRTSTYLLTAILLALALLVKPYALFFILPWLGFTFSKFGPKVIKNYRLYLFALIVLTPLVAWRIWIKQFPEGIPGSSWLYNFSNIRFSFAWFRWLFGERLGKLILGYWGLIPLTFGLLTKPTKKENWFYHLWFLGILLYFSVFAGGNIQHDYYQAIIIPMLVALLAKGSISLINSRTLVRPITLGLTIFSLFMMLGLSWYQVKEYYNVNNWNMVKAGIKANQILPDDARVVAPYNGDTAFLYQTNRSGWPIVQGDIKVMVDHLGATHYISTSYDDLTNQIINHSEYSVLEKNPDYVIVKLRYPPSQ